MCYVLCMKRTQNVAPVKGRKRKTTKRVAPAKGGTVGATIRDRIGTLIQRDCRGSKREFARRVTAGTASKTDYSPRVIDWVRGRNLPRSDSLFRIANAFNVSTDWLLGRVDNEREWVGDLANRLLHHVFDAYSRRAPRHRRDGLAHVLGGRIAEAEPPGPTKQGEVWPSPVKVGDTLPDGRIITHLTLLGLLVLDVDAALFLDSVTDRVFREAEAWEESHKEVERERVRADIGEMLDDIPGVAASIKIGGALDYVATAEERERVLKQLLAASLDPLGPIKAAEVITTFQRWRDSRVRKDHLEAMMANTHARLLANTKADPALVAEMVAAGYLDPEPSIPPKAREAGKRARSTSRKRAEHLLTPPAQSTPGGTPVAPQKKRPSR